jgi:hypothetical protein
MTLEQADISQTRADIARDVRAMRMRWAAMAVVLGPLPRLQTDSNHETRN